MGLAKPGDWYCNNCSYRNFASRKTCSKCNHEGRRSQDGDWNCVCGDRNFALRVLCRKCGKDRPSATACTSTTSSKPSAISSIISSISRVTGSFLGTTNKPFVRKPGDWDCTECTTVNFASRVACFKCNKAKNDYVKSDADNSCIICMEQDINVCIPCGHLCCCYTCALNMDKCPVCRSPYDPDTQVIKTYAAH